MLPILRFRRDDNLSFCCRRWAAWLSQQTQPSQFEPTFWPFAGWSKESWECGKSLARKLHEMVLKPIVLVQQICCTIGRRRELLSRRMLPSHFKRCPQVWNHETQTDTKAYKLCKQKRFASEEVGLHYTGMEEKKLRLLDQIWLSQSLRG